MTGYRLEDRVLRQPPSIFITGTDTGIGKTLISAVIMRNEIELGYQVAGFKPIASGAERTSFGLRNLDALLIQYNSSLPLPYKAVNPVTLEPPIAPHLGLQQINAPIVNQHELNDLADKAYENLSKNVDFVLVEGAGGWRVPISSNLHFSDLAAAFQSKVILVVGIKLGCINHALLTAEAILNDGFDLIGWVANCVDADMLLCDENIRSLEERLDAPRLFTIPHIKQRKTTEAIDASSGNGLNLALGLEQQKIVDACQTFQTIKYQSLIQLIA